MRPIPPRILRSTATVKACTRADLYQNQTYETYAVRRVHIQPTERIVKSTDRTSLRLNAVLFVDARLSRPRLDWEALLRAAHEAGGDVRVTVRGVEYTAMTVDALRDAGDALHHWEVGLV